MLHYGDKYTITTEEIDGQLRAVKTDGERKLTMPYYPERDSSALAGSIDEVTVWSILRDIAKSLPSETPVSPEHILIDGDNSVLSEWSRSHDVRFNAHEGYSDIWALGASVFSLLIACDVFNGRGGAMQTATTPIPRISSADSDLSDTVAACLAYNPADRPTADEIVKLAESALQRYGQLKNEPKLKSFVSHASVDELDLLWPEEME